MEEYKSFTIEPIGVNKQLVVRFERTTPRIIKTRSGFKTEKELICDEESLIKRIENLKAEGLRCNISEKALLELKKQKEK